MTLGSLAVTANPAKRAGAGVPLPHTVPLPFDDPAQDEERAVAGLVRSLDTAAAHAPMAAVVVETVQGEGGVSPARPVWLRTLASWTQDHGTPLIMDDIQMGCGRTGPFGGGSAQFLEVRRRGHAIVEDRIRCGKTTGFGRFPSRDFAVNAVWLELSLAAIDLLAWTRVLLLDGELATAAEETPPPAAARRCPPHPRRPTPALADIGDLAWRNELATAFHRDTEIASATLQLPLNDASSPPTETARFTPSQMADTLV